MSTLNTYKFEFFNTPETGETYGFPVQKTVSTAFTVNDEDAWHTPMREFIFFLSSIYGYEIDINKYEA
jgi:hypothetical protein